jgi:hypothetical protein
MCVTVQMEQRYRPYPSSSLSALDNINKNSFAQALEAALIIVMVTPKLKDTALVEKIDL